MNILEDIKKELIAIKGDWQENSRHSILVDDFSQGRETNENRLNILRDTPVRRD